MRRHTLFTLAFAFAFVSAVIVYNLPYVWLRNVWTIFIFFLVCLFVALEVLNNRKAKK